VVVPVAVTTAPTITAPIAPVASAAPRSVATTAGSSGTYAAATGSAAAANSNLIQVAAVSQIARGRELQQQLRQAGFDAYWESVKTKSGDVVRVRVSVDTATQTVADTLNRLKTMGFDPIVVAP
jgi:cell division septation protein DedD